MIVLGLGGNLGTDVEIVERFRAARDVLGGVRSARLYRTAPIGPEQPPYLNSAILVDDVTLERVHAVEVQLGRVRDVRWGPRTIDIDILVADRPIEGAIVPHPRLLERRFALAPLSDLVDGYADALDRVREQDVELIAEHW